VYKEDAFSPASVQADWQNDHVHICKQNWL